MNPTRSITTHYRWIIVALVTAITIINYLDRSAIGYAILPIKQEFGFNDTEFGLIGSAFAVGYICATFFSGLIVDRFGTYKVWIIASVVWSVSICLLTLSQGLFSFIFFRILLGIGEAPHFPAMVRTLRNWMPIQERARALGLNLMGVPLASTIGAPLTSYLIYSFGWKIAFWILGSLGIVWAIFWYTLFRTHPIESPRVSQAELDYIQLDDNAAEVKLPINWKKIFLNPCLLSNNFAFFSFGYLVFFAITWLPEYLNRTYDLNLKQIGLFLIAPWLTASIFIICGGFLSDWIWKNTKSLRLARTHIIWISQLLSALSFLLTLASPNMLWGIFCISLGTGFAFLPNSAFLALNADLSKHHAGTTQGVMSTFFAFSGVLSPFLTGLLTDLTGNFNTGILLMIALSALSSMGMLFFNFPDKKENRSF